MKPVDRLLATARAEIGYIEKETNAHLDDKTANAGDGNWNKYARDLDALGWSTTARRTAMPGATSSRTDASSRPSAWNWACSCSAKPRRGWGWLLRLRQLLQAKGQFHTSGPQPGDQIFFTKDGGKTMYHTGIVEKVAGGRVYTIEGNTSSAAGVVENGGCVQDKSYPLTYSKIGGYGRPDFSIVPERRDNDMDQTKFNEMFVAAMAEHRKQLRDNDSGDWSQKARESGPCRGPIRGQRHPGQRGAEHDGGGLPNPRTGRPALLSFRLGAWAGVMGRGSAWPSWAHRRLEFSKAPGR